MNRVFITVLAVTFLSAACSSPQTAEQPPASGGEETEAAPSSNRGTAEITLGATQVSINYGRPELQGRDMLSQVQDDQVWRLGMNEATTFETNSDLTLGNTVIQTGRYSIWAKKISDGWSLIFNSEPDVWGLNHNPASDIAEIPLETSDLAETVEQFTIGLNPIDDGTAEILMKWATLQLRAIFNINE